MRNLLVLSIFLGLSLTNNAFAYTLIAYSYPTVKNKSECVSKGNSALKQTGYKVTYSSSFKVVGKKGANIVTTIACDVASRAGVAFIIVNGMPQSGTLSREMQTVTTKFTLAR